MLKLYRVEPSGLSYSVDNFEHYKVETAALMSSFYEVCKNCCGEEELIDIMTQYGWRENVQKCSQVFNNESFCSALLNQIIVQTE